MENQSKFIADFIEMVAREQKLIKDESVQGKGINGSIWEANEFYNELVEKGHIKERGYSLRGIEDYHLMPVPRLNGN